MRVLEGLNYRDLQREAIERLRSQETPVTSIIPMQKNYLGDRRICLAIFARIPDPIASVLTDVQERLRRLDPMHHYFARESFHLTVQNAKVVADPPSFTREDAFRVCAAVSNVVHWHQKETVSVDGLIALPTSVSATVLFDRPMAELTFDLRDAIAAVGVPDDKTYIDPDVRFGNITLCRFTEPPSEKFLAECERLRREAFGSFTVDALAVASTNASYELALTEVFGSYQLG